MILLSFSIVGFVLLWETTREPKGLLSRLGEWMETKRIFEPILCKYCLNGWLGIIAGVVSVYLGYSDPMHGLMFAGLNYFIGYVSFKITDGM